MSIDRRVPKGDPATDPTVLDQPVDPLKRLPPQQPSAERAAAVRASQQKFREQLVRQAEQDQENRQALKDLISKTPDQRASRQQGPNLVSSEELRLLQEASRTSPNKNQQKEPPVVQGPLAKLGTRMIGWMKKVVGRTE